MGEFFASVPGRTITWGFVGLVCGISFAESALILYYKINDKDTPRWKAVLYVVLSIAGFVLMLAVLQFGNMENPGITQLAMICACMIGLVLGYIEFRKTHNAQQDNDITNPWINDFSKPAQNGFTDPVQYEGNHQNSTADSSFYGNSANRSFANGLPDNIDRNDLPSSNSFPNLAEFYCRLFEASYSSVYDNKASITMSLLRDGTFRFMCVGEERVILSYPESAKYIRSIYSGQDSDYIEPFFTRGFVRTFVNGIKLSDAPSATISFNETSECITITVQWNPGGLP